MSKAFRKLNSHYTVLFLSIWLISGFTINRHDQSAFTLQQMGVDAIVEHGTFTLGHSKLDILKPLGDTFHSKRGILPAKQPGQFAVAAVPYYFISLLGMRYEKNYVLTSALVTFFSTSLIAAIAMTLLYATLISLGYHRRFAMWATISVAITTHWLVFSSILHHDIIAASFLVIALFFSEKNLLHFNGAHRQLAFLTGLFAALTLFTSMLPALIVLMFGLYLAISLKKRHIIYSGIGFLCGLVPLGMYNYHYFGNVLTQANMAGNYQDTFFNFKPDQFLAHMNAYIGWGGISIWKYAPIAGMGFFGILLMEKQARRIQFFVLGATFLHLLYLFNIESKGTCMYGPRYLLPLLPLYAFGIADILRRAAKHHEFATAYILGAVTFYGFIVSVVGSIVGAMQCDLRSFTFVRYLADSRKLNFDSLPLAWPLIAAALIYIIYRIIFHLYQRFALKTGALH